MPIVPAKAIHRAVALAVLFCPVPMFAAEGAEQHRAPDFIHDVQPILAGKCLVCHGADKAEGGLRLIARDAALAELDSGSVAIVPGKPDESELIRRISSHDYSDRMPPEGDPLKPEEIETLRRWIAAGADWQTHWAYQPLRADPPPVVASEWVRSPIDAFVLARLNTEQVTPSPETDRATLIKRLHYDLLGLPPTPAEVDTFRNDASPSAYERLVDRLLASPHFGERWGRHWLDLARYADSDGYEKDNTRPDAWRYRDWVIETTNSDLPFDQFTIEQLAGDLLPSAQPEQVLATAFHRQTLTNLEGGADQEQFRVDAVFDRVETTGTVWLGLTVGCARCHTHKYDQITQREYYQLFALFNNADEGNAEVPKSTAAWQEYLDRRRQLDEARAPLEARLAETLKRLESEQQAWAEESAEKLRGNVDTLATHPLRIESIEADSPVEFQRLDDGSYLVTGANPERAKYTIVAHTTVAGVVGIQLEALAHSSLPKDGPARGKNGNFVVNELTVSMLNSAGGDSAEKLRLVGAEADYSQGRWPVPHAIDGNAKTGWAISPEMGKDHWARFSFETPLDEPERRLKIEIDQQYGTAHTLGRFRLVALTGDKPAWQLPEDVQAALKTASSDRSVEQHAILQRHFASLHPETRELQSELGKLEAQAGKPPLMSARVLGERTKDRRANHLLHRGDFLQPESPVDPGGLSVLPPLQARTAGSPPDRLDVARWLVASNNPLTPRVTANWIWSKLFGRGIVRTLDDFGVRGERPTHPELLDWLAGELQRTGWRRKSLIKTILMSSTYRQASSHRAELLERDPQNDWLARQNRFRIEGELVRDLSLSVAGLLSSKIGGPSVFPPMPAELRELTYASNFQWKTSEGEDRLRRGMYTFHKRTAPDPSLTTFDCPDGNTTKVRREVSNTPLQALTTLNNEVFIEAAQGLARRVLQPEGLSDTERITLALRYCLTRVPADAEVTRFQKLLVAGRLSYESKSDEAQRLVGETYAVPGVAASENAAWIATVRVMLNLDELLTRE